MHPPTSNAWPLDADGDVLRRMAESQLDFSAECEIEFIVDFVSWPPPQEAIAWLRETYAVVRVYEPSEGDPGYVLVEVTARLTYERVVSTQLRITEALREYGGICESWGVMHGPSH